MTSGLFKISYFAFFIEEKTSLVHSHGSVVAPQALKDANKLERSLVTENQAFAVFQFVKLDNERNKA